jgi:hypothetical protein
MTGDHPPLIVGIDGSERSHDALALAARLAESGQSISLEERTREAIDSLPDGDRVDGQVLDGDVASQFIAASAELDLLVLGSRGVRAGAQRAARKRLASARAFGGVPGGGRAPGSRRGCGAGRPELHPVTHSAQPSLSPWWDA